MSNTSHSENEFNTGVSELAPVDHAPPGADCEQLENGIAKLARAFFSALESLANSQGVQRFFEGLARLPPPEVIQAEIDKLPGDVQRVLSLCEFPVANSFFTLGDLKSLVSIYDRGGRDDALKFIIEAARQWLETPAAREHILEKWGRNGLLAPRMTILRDALNAHAEGKYTLSVPVLMTQVEGILAAASNHQGWMREARYTQYVNDLVKDEKLFGNHVEQFVRGTLLRPFLHGDTVFDLSRHAVLHGADVGYGTELNSIRMLALIDYLQELAKEKDDDAENLGDIG